MENHCDLFTRHAHVCIEWPLRWFAEALAALLALPTLNLLLSIKSGFHHLGTAVVAGHARLLPFCGLEPIIPSRSDGGSTRYLIGPCCQPQTGGGALVFGFGGDGGTPTRDRPISNRLLLCAEVRPLHCFFFPFLAVGGSVSAAKPIGIPTSPSSVAFEIARITKSRNVRPFNAAHTLARRTNSPGMSRRLIVFVSMVLLVADDTNDVKDKIKIHFCNLQSV